MEFHFRAGEERCASEGSAATSADSETAATRVHNGLVGGDGARYHGHGESSPPPAYDLDELLRRRAEDSIREWLRRKEAEAMALKAEERIRERMLRKEAEAMALEAEVRCELMEERASLLVRLAGGSQTRAAPAVPSLAPIDHQSVQVGSKVDVSAAKRKTPHVAAASATGSKKQKPDLTCTVCNITATSEVALQEHLRGKSHVRKAAAKPAQHQPDEDVFRSKVNGSAALPAKMGNSGGALALMAFPMASGDNLNLNCTVCGITASSQKNMQDHLKGKIHKRKTGILAQPLPKEDEVCSETNASAAVLPAKRKNSDVVPAASTVSSGPSSKNRKQDLTCTVCRIKATSEKGMQDHLKGKAHMKKAASLASRVEEEEEEAEEEVEGGYMPKKLKMVTDSGTLCEVVQLNGSVLCEVCDVQTPDRVTMMSHLQGTKHVSKQAKQKQREAVEPPAAVAAGGDGPGSEMVPMEASGVGRVDGGSLLCELCNVKVPSERAMRSHLSGRRHTNKQKAGAAQGNDGSGSETVSIEANGVRRLDGGILLCELCDVKALSECVMRTHLSGRKHTNKQKAAPGTRAGQVINKSAAVATIGSSSKEAASIVVNGSDDSVKKPAAGEMEVAVSAATPQVYVARVSSVAPMEVDEGAEAGDGAAKADEQEKADAEEEGSVRISVAPTEVDAGAEAGDGAAKADEQEKADAEEEGAQEAVNSNGEDVPVTDGAAQFDN